MAGAEEDFRHRLVTAGGEPGGAEVAPADMHGNGHVLRLGAEDCIQHFHIFSLDMLQIQSPCPVSIGLLFRAEFAPGGIVELQVPAAFIVEGLHCLPVGADNVVKKDIFLSLIHIRQQGILLPHAGHEVKHGGGRNGHLRHMALILQGFQETEMGKEGMIFGEIELSCNAEGGSLGLLPFKMDRPGLCRHLLTAGEGGQEIEMPEGAAEFAVREIMESVFLLFLHQTADFPIFHCPKLFGGNLSFFQGSPGLLQRLRS